MDGGAVVGRDPTGQGAADRGPEPKWHKQKGAYLQNLAVKSVVWEEVYPGQLIPNPKEGGGDNRGDPPEGYLSPAWADTGPGGQATVDFQVSMQPGDNFRVVADVQGDEWLSTLVAKHPDPEEEGRVFDGDEPAPDSKTTQLLTVWRKLHVEVDSMGAPFGTSVMGNITNVLDHGDGTSTVTTDQTLDDSEDRFVPGTLTDSASLEYDVLANTNGANFTVKVRNILDEWWPAEGAFTLVDDDVVPGDVPDPVTGWLGEKFEPAYIEAELDGGGDPANNDPDAPFALNMGGSKPEVDTQAALSRDVTSAAAFWAVHCLGCFQEEKVEDRDPDAEKNILGATGTKTSAVFSEQARDSRYDPPSKLGHTLVHEVGHLFGLPDEYHEPHPPGYPGIMKNITWGVFTDGNLDKIRRVSYPAGGQGG